jgi:hypothetical protein
VQGSGQTEVYSDARSFTCKGVYKEFYLQGYYSCHQHQALAASHDANQLLQLIQRKSKTNQVRGRRQINM